MNRYFFFAGTDEKDVYVETKLLHNQSTCGVESRKTIKVVLKITTFLRVTIRHIEIELLTRVKNVKCF